MNARNLCVFSSDGVFGRHNGVEEKRAQPLRCVLGMLNSLEVKVLPQPDGGEG